MRRVTTIGLTTLALLSSACGSPPISKELRTARDAYAEAQAGIASELAPAELDHARQALDEAEAAFKKDHKGQETRDLAYIAERRAQLATLYAQIEGSKREKKDLELKLDKLERKHASLTREELEEAQNALEAKQRELAREREALNKTAQELEAERKMREEAEKKLSAALSSLDVKKEDRGVVITLSGSVLFATGKYHLLPAAQQKLDEVAKALLAQGFKEIIVEGHSDSRGSADSNQALSLNRARAVREYLVGNGITATQITARGMGETRPVASNNTPDGRANNRRVELIVIPK